MDDTSIPAETLGARRLILLKSGVPLVRLNKGYYFIGDIIMAARTSNSFIDSTGILFTYKKSKSVPLIFRKITKRLPIPNATGTVVEVEGISSRFKTLLSLSPLAKVAGLLKMDSGYILYGIYDTMYKDSNRKV